jgi:hypothetical protein
MASALHWPVGSSRRVSSATRSDSTAVLGRYVDSRYLVAMRLVSGSALSMRLSARSAASSNPHQVCPNGGDHAPREEADVGEGGRGRDAGLGANQGLRV